MHRNQLAHEQEIRLRRLRPEKDRFYSEDPALRAAFYPEVIAAAGILVTRRWQDDVYNPYRRAKAYAVLGRHLGWTLHSVWDRGHRHPLHEWIDPDDRRTRLRSDQHDFAPIRCGGPDARWKTQCI
jgi:hypothetical protein